MTEFETEYMGNGNWVLSFVDGSKIDSMDLDMYEIAHLVTILKEQYNTRREEIFGKGAKPI